MEVTCNRKELLEAVQAARKGAATKSTLPILECALLRTEEGELAVTGYDMELAVTTNLAAVIAGEGALAVPARLLADWLKATVDPVVGLKAEGKVLKLEAGGARTQLEGMDPEEYPALPDPRAEESKILFFPAAQLQAAVAAVKHAAGHDETRVSMMALSLRWREGHLWLAATDSYRTARVALPNGSEFPDKWEANLPAEAWEVAAQLLGKRAEGEVEVCVALKEGEPQQGLQASLTWPGRRIVTRQLWALPNLERMFEEDGERVCRVCARAADLAAGVKALLPVARQEAEKIRVQVLADGLRLTAEANGNTASNLVAAVREGKELELAVSGGYLAEALGAMPKGAEVQFDFFGALKPMRLRCPEAGAAPDCLIMPMGL